MTSSPLNSGFTLIELVIVIVILGVLAVTAAPRFIDLQDDAQAASVQGVGAAFASAINLAHLKWRAGGHTGPVDNLDVFGNGQNVIDFNQYGWPAQSYTPYEASPVTDNAWDCTSLWNALLASGSPTVAGDTSADYQATYADGTCTFVLQAQPAFSVYYSSLTGEVTIDDTL